MENEKKRTIVIDLNRSNDPMNHLENDYEQLIQRDAWKAIHTRIATAAEKSSKCKAQSDEARSLVKERYHTTLAVLGRRGDGKSTFVLNVLEAYSENGKLKIPLEKDKERAEKVMPLNVIDGTLMETGEHPFLYVISAVKECVCSHMTGAMIGGKPQQEAKEKWDKSFRKLAVGLNALKDIGTESLRNEHWENDYYVMDKGLEIATGGMRLAEHFSNFLKASLEILGRDMFLLAFDDVDTQFEEGEKITETIRRYLNTPFLQVILVGDLELLTSLIRKKQWSMFGDLPRLDRKRKYSDSVRDLEDQYVLKLFKSENRIYLKTLGETMNDYHITIEGKPLYDSVDLALEDNFFLHDRAVKNICHQLLLDMPVRSFIQFFKIIRVRDKEEVNRMHFCREIVLYSVSKLMDYQIDLHANIHLNGFDRLALWLEKMNGWDSGISLTPTIERTDKDFLYLILGAIHSIQLTPDPAMLFNYFIHIGLASEWLKIRNPLAYLKQIINSDTTISFMNMSFSNMGALLSQPGYLRVTKVDEIRPGFTLAQREVLKSSLLMVDHKHERHNYLSIFALFSSLSSYLKTGTTLREHALSLEGIDDGLVDSSEYEHLNNEIVQWFKTKTPCVAIYLYHNITIRFFETIRNMEPLKAGDAMHRWIVAFLNAVLVEENLYYGGAPKRNTNATNSDRYFLENLNYYHESKEPIRKLELFDWVWRCPMWGVFLKKDPDSAVLEAYKNVAYYNDGINMADKLSSFSQGVQVSSVAKTFASKTQNPLWRRSNQSIKRALDKHQREALKIFNENPDNYYDKLIDLISRYFIVKDGWSDRKIKKYSSAFDEWYKAQQ